MPKSVTGDDGQLLSPPVTSLPAHLTVPEDEGEERFGCKFTKLEDQDFFEEYEGSTRLDQVADASQNTFSDEIAAAGVVEAQKESAAIESQPALVPAKEVAVVRMVCGDNVEEAKIPKKGSRLRFDAPNKKIFRDFRNSCVADFRAT